MKFSLILLFIFTAYFTTCYTCVSSYCKCILNVALPKFGRRCKHTTNSAYLFNWTLMVSPNSYEIMNSSKIQLIFYLIKKVDRELSCNCKWINQYGHILIEIRSHASERIFVNFDWHFICTHHRDTNLQFYLLYILVFLC